MSWEYIRLTCFVKSEHRQFVCGRVALRRDQGEWLWQGIWQGCGCQRVSHLQDWYIHDRRTILKSYMSSELVWVRQTAGKDGRMLMLYERVSISMGYEPMRHWVCSMASSSMYVTQPHIIQR